MHVLKTCSRAFWAFALLLMVGSITAILSQASPVQSSSAVCLAPAVLESKATFSASMNVAPTFRQAVYLPDLEPAVAMAPLVLDTGTEHYLRI